jgi:hypothetical protein
VLLGLNYEGRFFGVFQKKHPFLSNYILFIVFSSGTNMTIMFTFEKTPSQHEGQSLFYRFGPSYFRATINSVWL